MNHTTGQLIFDAPAVGSWNMAVDQALLLAAEQQHRATLRFYRWSQPTLSLGYFQNHQRRRLHAGSAPCPLVRRRSGGGAIVHDHELTYSLALPSNNRWSRQNAQLYDMVHDVIVELLADEGMSAMKYADSNTGLGDGPPATAAEGDQHNANVPDQNAFLCFQRRTSGDIVSDGFKVVGSAQRRLKHSLLQHGSILLSQSAHAEELPGIEQLHRRLDSDSLARKLARKLSGKLSLGFSEVQLGEQEWQAAENIEKSLFASPNWNLKR